MSSRNRFTINAACQPIVENVCASSSMCLNLHADNMTWSNEHELPRNEANRANDC
ncbi:hypothetical protein UFOVP1204_56 [uncultured Caudovirales phage]|uniref:Uncharacterized protein n=1 Tax=uncultured Caudovirales phage TaxID=2100421 RepID=A0A6J5MQS4_9CAUD|nr:hypothetical protein UFOVP473_45 [uncultured Caudovirales phage]CAB4176682.1 hypothetical protein UFOVP983_45 [uncultured Caudovirales phage]CAB4190260.1 hypothetical protein UFOVP1204_56 [uncultured Caudovirales phage]